MGDVYMGITPEAELSFSAAQASKRAVKLLVKSTMKYSESLKASNSDAVIFCNTLAEIHNSEWIKQSPHIDVAKYLRYFCATLQSINQAHRDMITAFTRDVCDPLKNFVSYDFLEMQTLKKKVLSTASEYESTRGKIDSALQGKKRIGSSKTKPADPTQIAQYERELERLKKEQQENQENFTHVLEQTHQKKETKLLKAMFDMVNIQHDYHEKSMFMLDNLKPKIECLETQIQESSKGIDCTKEGHLMVKSNAAMQGGWQKYWFVLKDGYLFSYKSKKDASAADQPLNIMFCTTRTPPAVPGKGGNCTFEIVTPDKKKPLLLQTETEAEKNAWLEAIQNDIEKQLNQNEPAVVTTENDSLAFKILQRVPGNEHCADCGSPQPDWASINLGILVCLECSGVHRNLGTHISKVRSTTLDTKAWGPELLLYMKKIGNSKFNEIYEYSLTEKISSDADRATRERFIRAKYETKAYCEPPSGAPDQLAYDLYCKISEPGVDATMDIVRYVAQGANLQWQNPNDEMKTILHQAVIYDKIGYVELLIQNNISIFSTDAHLRTPMHYAALGKCTKSAVILYKHGFSGAKQIQCKDDQNKTAVEIAFTGQADDIVTLLTTGDNGSIGIGFTIEDLYNGDPVIDRASEAPVAEGSPRLPFEKPALKSSGSAIQLPGLMGRPSNRSSSGSLNIPSPHNDRAAAHMSLPLGSKMTPINPDTYNAPAPRRGGGRGRGRGRGNFRGAPPSVPPRNY